MLLRRQRHLDRRPAGACRLRRSGEALRVRRLGGNADRRPRSGSDRRRDRSGAKKSDRPSLIACRTTIGFGAPTKAGTEKATARRSAPRKSRRRAQKLGWTAPAFEIPAAIREQWRAAGERGRPARLAWQKRLAALDADKRAEFERRSAASSADKLAAAVARREAKARATRRRRSPPAPRPNSRSKR